MAAGAEPPAAIILSQVAGVTRTRTAFAGGSLTSERKW
jgi:hypothetical protein